MQVEELDLHAQLRSGCPEVVAIEVREAVDTFIELYNNQWLPEKNGFISPSATREAWYARQAQGVAA